MPTNGQEAKVLNFISSVRLAAFSSADAHAAEVHVGEELKFLREDADNGFPVDMLVRDDVMAALASLFAVSALSVRPRMPKWAERYPRYPVTEIHSHYREALPLP